MILLTVGSQKFQFNRLIRAVDKLVENGIITEQVIGQIGESDYEPFFFEFRKFMAQDEFSRLLSQADIVITHGGTGVIVNALKQGRHVIGVPRLSKYGEHVDDHQIELLSQFSTNGMILKCEDVNELADCIDKARVTKCIPYISNTKRYIDELDKLLSEL